MRIVTFALANLAAIFTMAVLRVVATGRIDPHYGYAGSILKVIPSSVLVALLTTLAFWAVAAFAKRRPATSATSAALGAACGLVAYAAGWVLAEVFGNAAAIPALACFAVCGAAAPFFMSRRIA